jgi:penicillin V acylase-like amidase (Ntn superfamily)
MEKEEGKMSQPDAIKVYIEETANAAARFLRCSKIASQATKAVQARTALNQVADILAKVPGQEKVVQTTRDASQKLDDDQVISLCQAIKHQFMKHSMTFTKRVEDLRKEN